MQNVQEVVSLALTSHHLQITELKTLVTTQNEVISKLTRRLDNSDDVKRREDDSKLTREKIYNDEVRKREVKEIEVIRSRLNALESERFNKPQSISVPTTDNDNHNKSGDIHEINSRISRIEQSIKDNRKVVLDDVDERFIEYELNSGYNNRRNNSNKSNNNNNSDLEEDYSALKTEIVQIKKQIKTFPTITEVEEIQGSLSDAVECLKDDLDYFINQNKTNCNSGSNGNSSSSSSSNSGGSTVKLIQQDKNALLDEISLTYLSRPEITSLIQTTLEPLDSKIEKLQYDVNDITRKVSQLSSSSSSGSGGLSEKDVQSLITKYITSTSLSSAPCNNNNGGGTVSHAHLTSATTSVRESLLRHLESSLTTTKTTLLEKFDFELSTLKSSTYEIQSNLRSRIDDLEVLVGESNVEFVKVLNKKCYKSDVVKGLAEKADKQTTLNSIRLKADTTSVNGLLDSKAGKDDTTREIKRNNTLVDAATRDIQEFKEETRRDIVRINDILKRKADANDVDLHNHINGSDTYIGGSGSGISSDNWKSAVSDLSVNLRREINLKSNNEEILTHVNEQFDAKDSEIRDLRLLVDSKSTIINHNIQSSLLSTLTSNYNTTHSYAHLLWRSGKTTKGAWIPWEVQVHNTTPQNLLWKLDAETITCVQPGLYHVKCGVFTMGSAGVMICVNGEPVITLDPNTDVSNKSSPNNSSFNSEHTKRRNRHSAGDITCIGIDEILALPVNAMVGVRYDCETRAQGFLIIRKL